MKNVISVIVVCSLFTYAAQAEDVTVKSPDGGIEITVHTEGALCYEVAVDGKRVTVQSGLGLKFADGKVIGEHSQFRKVARDSHTGSWENKFGKAMTVKDCWNEAVIDLSEEGAQSLKCGLIVRAYDDGVAFRYDLPKQAGLDKFTITEDRTCFLFPADYRAWGGRYSKCAECQYPETTLSKLPPDHFCLPLLVETPHAYVAIAESELLDWAGMFLAGLKGSVRQPAMSGPYGVHASLDGNVVSEAPRKSPWRVLMIGRKPGELVTSQLIATLATPSRIEDTSWIKPGISAWDPWWTGRKTNTQANKEFIDLAADMGWEYQLVDWTWYGAPGKSDPTKWAPHMNMPELIAYAKDKGVKLIVWVHYSDFTRVGDETVFAAYQKWGVAGVKIDFMNSDSQRMVKWYADTLECAAKYHMLVNFHGAYKPAGLARTWPNYITQEGVIGQEHCRNKRFDVKHGITLPFTRGLLGPADITPGGFRNQTPKMFKASAPTTVPGTRARQLALSVMVDSPLLCMADAPESYRGQKGLEFYRGLPTVWDETRVLSAAVGEHLVEARRRGGQWWLVAMNNDKPLALKVNLDFLGKGTYTACVFSDLPESETTATAIGEETRAVTADEQLEIQMATAGGFAARLSPK